MAIPKYCPYDGGYCENENNPAKCHDLCYAYTQMVKLLTMARVPKKRWGPTPIRPDKVDVEAFSILTEIRDDCENFVKNGEKLYIYGKEPGNGKTTWALKILQQYLDAVWPWHTNKPRALFVHVPTFLFKFKDRINTPDPEFEDLLKNLVNCELVVWDDIGACKLTEYDHGNLLVFIDQRALHELSDVFTGNLGGVELEDALGPRLFSRVWKASEVVELRGKDRRSQK